MKKLCMLFLATVIFVCVFGCQNKEFDELQSQVKIEEQNKELVKKYIQEINNKNTQIYDEMCVPEYKFYVPSINSNPKSLQETKEFVKMVYAAFPDAYHNIKEIFADKDRVIVWYVFTGTQEGEFQGIPATGNKVICSMFVILKINNGKIIEEREEADYLGIMQQLGMELKRKD